VQLQVLPAQAFPFRCRLDDGRLSGVIEDHHLLSQFCGRDRSNIDANRAVMPVRPLLGASPPRRRIVRGAYRPGGIFVGGYAGFYRCVPQEPRGSRRTD
jgi:hypothetical protein